MPQREKFVYYCRGCGATFKKRWSAQCPTCRGFWNCVQSRPLGGKDTVMPERGTRVSLSDYQDSVDEAPRIQVGGDLAAIDVLLGGGFRLPSLIGFAGEAGSGKSTLVMQLLRAAAKQKIRCLYITGEESLAQLFDRSKRLGPFKSPRLEVSEKRRLDEIFEDIEESEAQLVAIDSVQKVLCESPSSAEELFPGSAQAITIATELLWHYAHDKKIAIILIGHVTSDGSIAGPHSGLIHQVDTVIYFDKVGKAGARRLRIPTSGKNRFGDENVVVNCRMTETGIVDLKVYDPNEEKDEPKDEAPPEPPKAPPDPSIPPTLRVVKKSKDDDEKLQ
jgi:DNA repair protein RadA/Sms